MGLSDFGSLKILVVDDEPIMVKVTGMTLRSLGVKTIKTAPDGMEAIQKLRNFPADAVICDWVMLPQDGLSFCRQIRQSQNSPNPDIPIIMLTMNNSEEHVRQAMEAGVTAFLSKPVSKEKLSVALAPLLEMNR